MVYNICSIQYLVMKLSLYRVWMVYMVNMGKYGENLGKYGVRWFKMVLDGAGFRWL